MKERKRKKEFESIEEKDAMKEVQKNVFIFLWIKAILQNNSMNINHIPLFQVEVRKLTQIYWLINFPSKKSIIYIYLLFMSKNFNKIS